jgi:hypothetical protein
LASEQILAPAVEIYLCRDKNETILKVLDPDSLVVIGGWKRWWSAADHRVILANELVA